MPGMGQTWKLVVALAALFAMSGCDERSPTIDLGRVKTLVAKHEYEKARSALAEFEAQTGGSPQSTRLMIASLLGLGDGFAAAVYIDKLGANDISDTERKTLLAHSLIVRDRPFDAITLLTEQLPRTAWTSETYRIAVWANRAYERTEDSDVLLAEGLKAFPQSGPLLALQSRRLLDAGNVDGAAEQAERALSLDAGNFEALLVLAETALRRGDLDRSLAFYRRAVRQFPNQPLPKVNIVGILIDQQNLVQAKVELRKARADHPGFPLLQFQQARIYFLDKDFLAAQRELNAAWVSLESYVPAQILSAQVSIAMGNRDTAAAMLERAGQDSRFAGEIEMLRAKHQL